MEMMRGGVFRRFDQGERGQDTYEVGSIQDQNLDHDVNEDDEQEGESKEAEISVTKRDREDG